MVKKPTKAKLIEYLDDYKRSNKNRKAKLLERWGFETQEEYFRYIKHIPGRKTQFKSPSVKVKAPKVAGKLSGKSNKVDYVVAFDCTGSMSSYIRDVRNHVTSLIPELIDGNKDLKMKIVSFGDYCDIPECYTGHVDKIADKNTDFGKAYQEIELTNDKNALIKFVKNSENTSGGDGDEFYGLVLNKIYTETDWRKDSTKVLLLIADANDHTIGQRTGGYVNKHNWTKEVKNYINDNIQIDTLTIDEGTARTFYKPLSEMTGGVSIPFRKSKGMNTVLAASVSSRSDHAYYSKVMEDAKASGDAELIGAVKSFSGKL